MGLNRERGEEMRRKEGEEGRGREVGRENCCEESIHVVMEAVIVQDLNWQDSWRCTFELQSHSSQRSSVVLSSTVLLRSSIE